VNSNPTESLLLQRTRPRPIPAEYDRSAEGIPPGPASVGVWRMLVTYEANNHLVCDQLNAAGGVIAEGVIVAKPPELRHQVKWYYGLTGVTTTTQNKVTVTGGGYAEKWIVRPPYIDDVTELAVMIVPDSLGWDLGGAVPEYLDLNVAGRRWAVDVNV